MIGRTVSHYKIIEELGRGGMGVVYKALDTRLERTVALKFPSSHLLGSDEKKKRFIHEAQAEAALSHPNICTVYEIDEFEDRPFIAEGPINDRFVGRTVEVQLDHIGKDVMS